MIDKINIYLDDGAVMPTRAHADDAGMDLYSRNTRYIMPHGSEVFDTGVHVEIPRGYVGFLKSKSGLNVKYGLNGEGVIDSGYQGSIVVKLYNHSDRGYTVYAGDKIIQLVMLPIITPSLQLVDNPEMLYGGETERKDNGFGSSGR